MHNMDQVHAQDCHQNVTGHRISHKKYTRVQHRNCDSGPWYTQAGPAHAAGHVEMAWTDQSHHFWHALLVGSGVQKRSESLTGTVSQATKTNSDCHAVNYLYRSGHWIG